MIDTTIESIHLCDQRYETLGDYYYDKDNIRNFKISKTGNDLYDDLIFIHEFIEEVLTRNKGITEEEIMKFDLKVEEDIENGKLPIETEPGDLIDSPYRLQHKIAENVEKLILEHLDIDFDEYNTNIINLFKKDAY